MRTTEAGHFVITDETTVAELHEALGHLNRRAAGIGRCWYAGKAAVHRQIDQLLTELDKRRDQA